MYFPLRQSLLKARGSETAAAEVTLGGPVDEFFKPPDNDDFRLRHGTTTAQWLRGSQAAEAERARRHVNGWLSQWTYEDLAELHARLDSDPVTVDGPPGHAWDPIACEARTPRCRVRLAP